MNPTDNAPNHGHHGRSAQGNEKLSILKNYPLFLDYIKKKNYSYNYEWKVTNYIQKLSKSVYFFNYAEVLKVKSKLKEECYHMAVSVFRNYLKEKYLDDNYVVSEMGKIKTLLKRPKRRADIYTPSDAELKDTLEKLKVRSPKLHQLYVALVLSGARISEIEYYSKNPSKFKVISKDGFKKVYLNYSRGSKHCVYLYFPSWFNITEEFSVMYLRTFVSKNKDILRPKYIRTWFYSKCIDMGIPGSVADYYQGRSAFSIGDKHYLDKERMADKCYLKVIDNLIKLNELV